MAPSFWQNVCLHVHQAQQARCRSSSSSMLTRCSSFNSLSRFSNYCSTPFSFTQLFSSLDENSATSESSPSVAASKKCATILSCYQASMISATKGWSWVYAPCQRVFRPGQGIQYQAPNISDKRLKRGRGAGGDARNTSTATGARGTGYTCWAWGSMAGSAQDTMARDPIPDPVRPW